MLQEVYAHFAGSCMMLMHPGEEEAHFCGTAFLIHREGYLLTASSCVEDGGELIAVPPSAAVSSGADGGFEAATLEEVTPIPVRHVAQDSEQGLALLKLIPEMQIMVPAHIMGNPASIPVGSSLMALGFSFGHHRLHNLVGRHATLSSKIQAPDGSRLLLFDAMVRDGDRGGPLVSPIDGRVIGVIMGTFDPVDFWREEHPDNVSVSHSVSYAASIEYGTALLEAQGVQVQ